MPLAAYSYPHPPYNSTGSGVNNQHPAPPVLGDGIHYFPPGPYPFGYPPYYATPAPPYCCPYADPRLHHGGVLPQSTPHAPYSHLHHCPGAPYCSLPADGVPPYSVAPINAYWQDGHGSHDNPPIGPAFALDSSSNHRSPHLFYPQMPPMPLWKPLDSDERPSCSKDAASEVEAVGKGNWPPHSLVPCHDNVQGAKPNNSHDGTPQWRGFPVMWKGNAPFALVPLSNIDGEQNLFVPRNVFTQSAPEQPLKNASAYVDWPLLAKNHLPIMWKQGLVPATHEDGKVKLNAKDSLNDEDDKVKLKAKDSPNDEDSSSKPFPVVWDGKAPLVLLPAMNEAGKEAASFPPFKLMPITKEVGQESSKLQPQPLAPSGKERQQDSSKSHTNKALVTASNDDERESRELAKQKALMPKRDGPIKVIPVVQLPTIDSSRHKEISVQKELPSVNAPIVVDVISDVGQGQAAVDHTHEKPQAVKQVSKTVPHAQHVSKQDSKGPSKDVPVDKKTFPAIKLVPASDVKRCKSPRKNVTTAQQKPAVQETQGVKPAQDGCHAGAQVISKDAPLHDRVSGPNSADVKLLPNVNGDGKAADEAVSHKDVGLKLVSSSTADGKTTEEAVFSKDVDQGSIKVLPFDSMGAADSLCDAKTPQASWADESEKPQVKMMSQDSAAKCIQAVYRGYCVRRSQPLLQLRIIKEVESNMPKILKQLDRKAEVLLKEPFERRKLSESVMALLLKLDTVQGRLPYVREQRKTVAKELSRVLETLDDIEQERASLFTPKAVMEVPKELEELLSQETSSPTAATASRKACSSTGTLDREMSVDRFAIASNANTSGISEEGEGVAVSESNENALSGSNDLTREEKVGAGSKSGALELPPAVLQLESMDEKSRVDKETPGVFNPCGNLKEQVESCQTVNEEQIQYAGNKGEEEIKEEPGLEGPPEVVEAEEVAVDPCGNLNEQVDSCESGNEQQIHYAESKGEEGKTEDAGLERSLEFGDKEEILFDPCGNLKEQIGPSKSVKEQQIQYAEIEGKEEIRGPGLEGPLKVADTEEGATIDSESAAASDADAFATTCVLLDAETNQKMGNQDEEEVVGASPIKVLGGKATPIEVLVGEETDEHAKLQKDAMHLADSDQPAERAEGRLEDTYQVIEELKEDALVPSSSTKLIGEEKIEELIEPSQDSVQSQQLDESNELKEASPEGAQEGHTHPAEVLHENKCTEQLSLLEDYIVREAQIDGSELKLNEPNNASEVLVGVEPMGFNKYAMEVALKEEGEVTTAQHNLQGMLHEEIGDNVTHGDEVHRAWARQEQPVGAQQVEERESNLAFDAADVDTVEDSTRLSMCEPIDDIHFHGNIKGEEPLFFDGHVVSNVEDGKAETMNVKDGSVDSTRAMQLDKSMAFDSQSKDDTDAANALAAGCPFKEEVDFNLEDGSMLDAHLNKCACDSEKMAWCIQESVDDTSAKLDEDIESNQRMKESWVPQENIAVESRMLDAGNEQNLCLEESGLNVQSNDVDENQDPSSAKSEEADMQKHCGENLAVQSRDLLAVVEELTKWNQQQANMIMQLSERMSRLEEARNSKHNVKNSSKGRSRRRKISVHM